MAWALAAKHLGKRRYDVAMRIREARKGDLGTIVEFNARLALESENIRLEPTRLREGVARVLGDKTLGRYLVAEDNGVPIGQLGLTYEWSDWRNGIFWWIQSVYVVPGRRREGVLKALHRRVLELAPEHGVCGLRLYVDRHNVAAKAAYRQLGLAPGEYEMYETDFVLDRAG